MTFQNIKYVKPIAKSKQTKDLQESIMKPLAKFEGKPEG